MKRILTFILLLNLMFSTIIISTNAAVVSDSDGAAFLTKQEFEDMKDGFDKQLTQYADSIDKKVDGAIASYLAGINIMLPSREKMIHYDWNNIEFINYEIRPEFKIPSYTWWVTAGFHSTGAYSGSTTPGNAYDRKAANVCGFKKYDKSWSTNETCIRPLATLLHGNESSIGKVAWNGCAARWNEKWNFNKFGWGSSGNMYGSTDYKVRVFHPFTFLSTGYIKNKTMIQLLEARLDFLAGSSWATLNNNNVEYQATYTYEDGFFYFNVSLDQLENGISKLHDHIFVENGASTKQYLSVESFVNTINNCTYQTIKDADIGAAAGDSGTKVTGSRCIYINQTKYQAGYIGSITWSYTNEKMPLVGLLPTQYNTNSIYQEAYDVDASNNIKKRSLTWNGATVENAPALTLQNGLEVCISEDEKEYRWEIEFDEVTLTSSSGTRKNQNEVDVYLSTVPFGDGVSTTAPLKIIDGNTEKNYFTTTNRKGTFKWKVQDTKVIYMKCKPHFKTTDTGSEQYLIRLKDTSKNIIVIS